MRLQSQTLPDECYLIGFSAGNRTSAISEIEFYYYYCFTGGRCNPSGDIIGDTDDDDDDDYYYFYYYCCCCRCRCRCRYRYHYHYRYYYMLFLLLLLLLLFLPG